jgi:hypothetical protein
VQDLLDVYEKHDREFERERPKILDDLWKSIRASASFNATIAVYKLGSPRNDGEGTRDLFEYLQGELAKIGQFKCAYELAGDSPCIKVTWDRYDLRLPAGDGAQ